MLVTVISILLQNNLLPLCTNYFVKSIDTWRELQIKPRIKIDGSIKRYFSLWYFSVANPIWNELLF